MKNIKKTYQTLLLALGILFSVKGISQTIPTNFFGQNAWMPDTIGSKFYGGKLHKNWDNIKNSNCAMVRFGGIAPDENKPTNFQYIKMIDSIRAKGMEPIMQVPFHKWQYNAEQAAQIVKYINVTMGKNVKYWVIGNEPDLGYSYTSAAQVAAYFKPFASAMKAVDPSILTIGPECAWYNQGIINGLTTPNGPDDITGKDANGRYYLDVISFHTYPFNGTQNRQQVITKLTDAGGLQDNLTTLNARVSAANIAHGRTGAQALRTAITEANINYKNDAGDNLNGVGVNSFIGGQFVAEMMGIGLKNNLGFINLWSVIEGNSQVLNIGYIDGPTGNKKPLYWHYKMMAENFKGSFVNGTSSSASVKVFGSNNGQNIQVLILNEDMANSNFTLRLNTTAITSGNPLKVNMNLNIAGDYNDIIQGQSSILLTFNPGGQLVKKTEYTIQHAANNQPPSVKVYTVTGTTTGVGEVGQNGTAGAGIEEESGDIKNFSMKMFPNPSNGVFTIQIDKNNKYQKEFEIEMYDIMGRKVFAKTTTFSRKEQEINPLENSIADGTYIVKVKEKGDEQNMKTEKIVLVR